MYIVIQNVTQSIYMKRAKVKCILNKRCYYINYMLANNSSNSVRLGGCDLDGSFDFIPQMFIGIEIWGLWGPLMQNQLSCMFLETNSVLHYQHYGRIHYLVENSHHNWDKASFRILEMLPSAWEFTTQWLSHLEHWDSAFSLAVL